MAMEKIELSAALQNLATQTNIDKVTGVYNGVPANIAKADLASVVAGVMGMNAVEKTADDILEEGGLFFGVVYAKANDANFPRGALLLSFNCYANNVFQIAYNMEGGGSYMVRRKSSSGISSWKRFDNFGYNTLAELAGGMGIGLKKGYTIEPGDEVDLGVSSVGVYVLTNSDSGNAAMYLVSSYPEGMLSETGSSGSGTRFSTSLTAEGFVGFGRKETNGNLFIVNNRTSGVTVVVRYYT